MTLRKRYRRNLRENRAFYVSATVLTVISMMLFYLFNIAGEGIIRFGDEFFARNNVEDAEFRTYLPIDAAGIEALEQEYDVQLAAQHYVNIEEEDYTARVFERGSDINRYEITVGRDVREQGEIILSEGYANNMDVELGNKVTLEGKAYRVVGYFQRPDYLYMLEEESDSYKNISSFFLAYLTDEDFAALGETPVQYFAVYGEDMDQDDRIAFRQAVNDEYRMQSYTSAGDNMRIQMVDEQAKLFLYCSYILLVTVPLIAVFIICITMNRRVKSEQRLIGTLSALGYRRSALMRHYAGFAAIPGLVGGVLCALITAVAAQPYGELGLADYEPMRATFTLSPYIALLGILIPTLMYVLGALLSVRRLLRQDTVNLLNAGIGGSRHARRMLTGSSVSFRVKFALRSLLGNPARSLVVFLGVFLGSYISLYGFACIDTTKAIGSDIREQVGDYAQEYILSDIRSGEAAAGEAVLIGSLEGTDDKSVTLCGVAEQDSVVNSRLTDGGTADFSAGCYLTEPAAYLQDVETGDTLELLNPLTLEKTEIEVLGILANDKQNTIYTSRAHAAEILGYESDQYNAVLSDEERAFSEDELASTIKLSAINDQMDTVLTQMGPLIYAMIVIGVVICIAAVYVAVNMLVTENRNNISMLKVLGYSDRRINRIVLRVNHILVPLGILAVVPFLKTSVEVFFRMETEAMGMLFHCVVSPRSYLITILLIVVSYFASLRLLSRKVRKVSMVESLKDNRE